MYRFTLILFSFIAAASNGCAVPSLDIDSSRADESSITEPGYTELEEGQLWKTKDGKCLYPKDGSRPYCLTDCEDVSYWISFNEISEDFNSLARNFEINTTTAQEILTNQASCLAVAEKVNFPRSQNHHLDQCEVAATDGKVKGTILEGIVLPDSTEETLIQLPYEATLSDINITSCSDLEWVEQSETCLIKNFTDDCLVYDCIDIHDPLLIGYSNGDGTNPAKQGLVCLLYTSPSPRDATLSRMPSSA